jgi:YidC/Oxa1 family membrane protein insertase
MDRKAIIVVVICVALMLSWTTITKPFYKMPAVVPGSTNQLTNATHATGTNAALTATSAAPATPAIAAPTTPAPAPVVAPNTPEELVILENTNARYTFTSHGGGLKLVELKAYPETIACGANKDAPTNKLATLNRAPVAAMTLLGGPALQGDGVFQLTKTAAGVRAEKLLTNGLYLVKDFTPSTNYLLSTSVRLENRSAQPLALPAQEWVIGTATPLSGHDDKAEATMGLYWYTGDKENHIQEGYFANRTLGCIPGTPKTEYQAGEKDVVWAAVHNQFFAMIAIPKEKAPHILARHIELPAPTDKERAADPRLVAKPVGFQAALLYPATVLDAGKSIERHYDIFAGPKEYHNLEQLGVQYKNDLEIVMNFGGFFGWFAKILLLSMNQLHQWGLAYGLTIVVITVIIKLLFWPLTTASTRSMKRMAELQPQMKAIQDKYKEDPAKMNQKVMEFMREQGQPARRLPPAPAPDAGVLWLLHHAPGCHRTARREFPVGVRPLQPGHHLHHSRPQFPHQHPAAPDGRHDALAGQHDAALPRHGPRPAENHEVHALDDGRVLV